MKYKNTAEDTRRYNRTKNTKEKTVDCSGCGNTVPMKGENCVSFGIYACEVCRQKGDKMEDEKEKITIELDAPAEMGLYRLARAYKLGYSEVIEKLIKEADSKEAEKVLKKEGPKAQSAYYDGPKAR